MLLLVVSWKLFGLDEGPMHWIMVCCQAWNMLAVHLTISGRYLAILLTSTMVLPWY